MKAALSLGIIKNDTAISKELQLKVFSHDLSSIKTDVIPKGKY